MCCFYKYHVQYVALSNVSIVVVLVIIMHGRRRYNQIWLYYTAGQLGSKSLSSRAKASRHSRTFEAT